MYLFLGLFSLFIIKAREHFKWILFFLISIGLIRVVSIFFAENGLNTTPFYHVIGFLELVVVFKIYQTKTQNVIWKWILFVFVLIYLLNSFLFQSIWEMNGLMQAIVQLFIFSLSTNYLFNLYLKPDRRQGAIPVFFYANAGFMFYATGSFIFFLINERLIIGVTSELFDYSWLIEATLGLIRLIFIGITMRLINGK